MFGLIMDVAGMLNQLRLNNYYFNLQTVIRKFFMDLPVELRNPRNGLINIKNKNKKGFLRCQVRHINPSKERKERIKKTDKKIAKKLIIMELSFPCKKKILIRLK